MFREGLVSDYFRVLQIVFPMQDPAPFQELSALETRDISREWGGAEKVLPWAGPLLLSWAGLLGPRELMASGQRCRETALPRSSSSAEHSREESTACRHRGETSEAERGYRQPRVGNCVEFTGGAIFAALNTVSLGLQGTSWRDVLELAHPMAGMEEKGVLQIRAFLLHHQRDRT